VYSGGRCVPPPLVNNAVARLNQTSRSVTFTCMRGHRFPGGLTVKTVYCHADGSWDYNIPHCDGLCSASINVYKLYYDMGYCNHLWSAELTVIHHYWYQQFELVI